ncbi:hypothetical protein EP30_01135 [Bifidobacterium sp. UTCIF-39]|uniref:hypothetical protein n=1 Tax=Bifidobacterium sp. UTCIF-39 TaxID=1465359 RepID=UPI001129573B|nr:hypothetical protein [Bifidobacterium sp. UTCIF-39]TPF97575.1 hypothetical protein EP30_01135 [Bifidobacterium sp. UTCIF-39]
MTDADVYQHVARILNEDGSQHVLIVATYIPPARDAYEHIRALIPRSHISRRAKTTHLSRLNLTAGGSLTATNTATAAGRTPDILVIVGNTAKRDELIVKGLSEAAGKNIYRVEGI